MQTQRDGANLIESGAAESGGAATYKRIEHDLRRKIAAAVWPAGGMLPSRRELARQYGVSTVTVERAISGLVSEGMLRADDRRGTFVAAATAALGVLPAPDWNFARGRSSFSPRPADSTMLTVGIVASLYEFRNDHLTLNNFWVRLIVEALERGFSGEGETTRFFNRVPPTPDAIARPLQDTLAEAVASGVDALVIIAIGVPPAEMDAALAFLDTWSIPVSCVTSSPLSRPALHAFTDNHSGGYEAAQHLIRAGAREILIPAPFRSAWLADRIGGARDAVMHAGLPEDALTVYPEDRPLWINEMDPRLLGRELAVRLFDSGRQLDALLAPNDGVAFGILDEAETRGLVAGRDFRIIGFDDHPDARARQLTSLRPATEGLGAEAIRLLRQSIEGRADGFQVRLRWQLISRASSRATTDRGQTPT